MKEVPFVVIGAGAAGLVIAIGLARAGKKVILIEQGHWGGDCTNFGCIPSKALIAGSKKNSKENVLQRVRNIVRFVRSREEPEALEKLGIETLTAIASFVDPHTISTKDVNGNIETIRAKKIVIATGSKPKIPKIEGIHETPFLTNETIFQLEAAPKTLIIVGGGPIGVELAQAFHNLGTAVTLIHSHQHILGREPKEASDILVNKLQKEGMQFYLGIRPISVSYQENQFHLRLEKGEEIVGEQLLVATGREPNLFSLNLEQAKINFDEKGVLCDKYARTSKKHIFAVGDAAGPPFFTHLAENRARSVLTTLLLSPFWKKKIDYKQAIPRVTYTDPEIASLGLTEEEAMAKYGVNRVAVYVVPMEEVDRAITHDETNGFVKIITKRLSSRILGATIMCPRAGEMLCEIAVAMKYNIPLRKLASVIHPYPTYSLAIRKAADLWFTRIITPFLLRDEKSKK